MRVAVIMGSKSDLVKVEPAILILKEFGVKTDVRCLSAHRAHQKLSEFVKRNKGHQAFKQHIVLIFDECHRSQFGDMHKTIAKTFTDAQYFGFTGTPRFEINKSQDGRSTADIFGKCLHTYLIKDAIKDENVLGFSVDYIKTMESQIDDEQEMVEGIDTDEVFMADARIALIANHIIDHHNTKTRDKKCFFFVNPK